MLSSSLTSVFSFGQVFLNKHPEISRKLKNFTDFHSYKDNVDLLDKIDKKIHAKGDKIGAAIVTDKDDKINAKIQNKINNITVKPVPSIFSM